MDVRDEREAGSGAEPLGLLHSGSRYSLGFGHDFYGIWDAVSPTEPLDRFDATPEGRKRALDRYFELEPDAQPALTPKVEPLEEKPGRTRRRWITAGVVLAVVAGTVVAIILAGGGANEGGEEAAVTGTTAHVEMTGAFTITEDLQQKDVELSGINSLREFVHITWTGDQIQSLTITLVNPLDGPNKTSEISTRFLDIVLAPSGEASPGGGASPTEGEPSPTETGASPGGGTAGEPISFRSSHGECTINSDAVQENGFAGSFTCEEMSIPGVEGTISFTGTLQASTS
jgi:hypothetical protein